MEPSGILVDRTNRGNQINKIMNNSGHLSPKSRPLPQFFIEQSTFSTKKEKQTPKLINPPRPPIKSCPPISRLKPYKKPEKDIPKIISFINNNFRESQNLTSEYYDANKTDLFIEQCFVSEGSLGCGSFGKVYKVVSKEDNKYYAIKKSRDKFKGLSDRKRKLEEVAKHEELPPHPNCVRFYRAWEEKQRLYIQTELCKTSLSKYAEQNHEIPETKIWSIIVDLLQALKHLHDRNLVHMDIKPENIFITFDGHCKLGDFGLVIDLKKNDLKEVQEGDPKYLAPEILQNCMNITCAADIFSLGMTILELATDLDLPRSGELWHQLRSGQIPSNLIRSLSLDLVAFIMKLIEPNHLKRLTVNELIKTPTVRYLISYKEKSLHYYLNTMYCQWNNFWLTIWCFFIHSYRHIKEKFKYQSFIEPNSLNAINFQSSSTPKKTEIPKTPRVIINDQQYDLIDDRNTSFNDTISTNNSCGRALDDSSSFGDLSGFSNHNRSHDIGMSSKKNVAKTEPVKKIIKNNNYLEVENSYRPKSSSPCKTPPWRPMSSFYTDNTPNGLTNKKLIFDEYEDLPKDSYKSVTPSPTDQKFNLKQKANRFYQELSASPASIGDNDESYSSSSSTEQISVKLNYKVNF